jgi:hypothetical protein
MTFEVFTRVKVQMVIFWVYMPSSIVGIRLMVASKLDYGPSLIPVSAIRNKNKHVLGGT